MSNENLALEQLTQAHADYEAAIAEVTKAEEKIRRAMELLQMGGDGAKKITVYGQRDSPWGGDLLGAGPDTMAKSGCLVTSMASILTDAGYPADPGQLNVWLRTHGGFVDGTNFVFASVDAFKVIKFRMIVDTIDVPAPMAMLDTKLAKGSYVIVKIKVSNTVPQHYLRYVGAGQVMDPYYADISPLVPRYRGKDAAQAILRYVIYDRGMLG